MSTHRPLRVVCPRCRAEVEPLPVVYGLPTPEAFLEYEAGRLAFGGCMIGPESPEFECPACGGALPFASEPWRGRRGRTVSPMETEPRT